MSFDEILARGRAMAEARMTSRVRVRRLSDRTQKDSATGRERPVWSDVHIDLPFRLDGAGNSDGGSRGVVLAGVTYEQATAIGHMPASTRDLADDDLIEIVAGEWAGDVYRIVADVRGDQKTARRLPIVEENRPKEWD